jgi:hypothetical protein
MTHQSFRPKILVAAMPVLAILAGTARAQDAKPPVPKIAGPFINIYLPQPDVFILPTVTTTAKDGSITYKQGETYQDWRSNDHTFIRDNEGRWHCFGITKPWIAGDNGHAGEGLCFHAIAPKGDFGQAVAFQSWRDLPKIQIAGCGWAPHALKIGTEYTLVSSNLDRAKSSDLLTLTEPSPPIC